MTFDELSNPWSEYLLPDGRKMRIRHVLIDVVPAGIMPDGQPAYNLKFSMPLIWIEPAMPDQPAESAPKGALQ
jgi:hypothetical protein